MSLSDDAITDLLASAETIAVVGCSSTPGKAAHDVPKYLDGHGYNILPVNPFADEILGREAVDSLADIDESVDIVDVFRPSDEVPEIIDSALDNTDDAAIWLQLGIDHPNAVERARAAGRSVVADRCMKIEHGRLIET
ncbi:CoA-binding protein [Halococcoides cellulosivorans]|uniref:CoA-binding protein n=1 Tax=Halococcoides cellulosivorans TaxID=1679096 RepID=A0A2R4X2N2_9EURY|nr:CoA-binding protein [Halococcoides cellulosivorans]AWB28058.1 CoA-binding protein [Halococcoides cellulosivorans]